MRNILKVIILKILWKKHFIDNSLQNTKKTLLINTFRVKKISYYSSNKIWYGQSLKLVSQKKGERKKDKKKGFRGGEGVENNGFNDEKNVRKNKL